MINEKYRKILNNREIIELKSHSINNDEDLLMRLENFNSKSGCSSSIALYRAVFPRLFAIYIKLGLIND